MTNTMTYPVCDQCDCVAGCSKNPEPCPILLAECIASGQVSAQQIEAHHAAGEVPSCSLYCDRPACVKAQRDELRAQLEAVGAGGVGLLMPPTAQPAHAGDDGEMRSPAYNFDAVNEFVHESDAQYEELQALCLGLASALEKKQVAQPAKGLFVDMMESHGLDFVAEIFHQSAQPAETPDAFQVNAAWQSFFQTTEYRQCLKWAKSNRAPGALFSAFLAGANSTAQPQQSTPAVQQGAAMPKFELYEYAPYGMRESRQGTWVQLSEVAAAWPKGVV